MFYAYNYLIQLLETDKRAFEYFKWLGNLAIYISATAICISVSLAQTVWPFVVYIFANLIWIKAAQIAKDRPLMWMQLFFVFVNLYAVWIRV